MTIRPVPTLSSDAKVRPRAPALSSGAERPKEARGPQEPRERRRWKVALSLLVIGGVAGLALVLILAGLAARGPRSLSVALHSALLSDYSADPLGIRLPEIRLDIIEDVIHDQPTPTLRPGVTPPTTTPAPPASTSSPGTGTPLATPTASSTGIGSTRTPTRFTTPPSTRPGPTPTATRGLPATATNFPTFAPTETVPPRDTETPAPPPPTDTPQPPPPQPTDTPPPPPTDTLQPPPPTATNPYPGPPTDTPFPTQPYP